MLLLGSGLTLNDLHSITYGMGINFMYAHINSVRRSQGMEVSDPEKQYRIMKANLPAVEEAYRAGDLSRSDYERYIKALEEWEKM